VGDGVLLVAGVIDVRAQERGVEEIDDAEAVAVDFVLVRRTDAAAGGADGLAAGSGFRSELDHAVVRQDDLGAVGDEELAVHGETGFAKLFDLGEEGGGIKHDAVADDAFAAGAQNAARNELQDELFAVDDDGVTCVVAAGVAGDDIELFREDVDDLALAFVAPLGSEDDGGLAALRARRELAFDLAHEGDAPG